MVVCDMQCNAFVVVCGMAIMVVCGMECNAIVVVWGDGAW